MGAVRAAGKRAQQDYKLAMAIHVTRCITGQGIPAYRACHEGLTGLGGTCIQGRTCRPYSSWGVPAYKIGHAGLTGLGSTCIQGRTCWPYGAYEYLHTGYYMQALQVLGIPAYRAWHSGLTGLGSTCIQGRACWPYRPWEYLHTRQGMLAFRSAAGFMCLSGIEGVWRREAELCMAGTVESSQLPH